MNFATKTTDVGQNSILLTNPESGTQMHKNNSANLDFIRTIAVLAVVLRHLLGEFGIETFGPFRVQFLGIFGVMLFFVLTAHVLMRSLERLQTKQAHGVAWRFMVQRTFRIYPMSILIVLIGSVGTWWGGIQGFLQLNTVQTVANLLLVQNLTGAPSVIGPLWSLPIEVQMYLFLPVVFILVRQSHFGMFGVYGAALLLGIAAFKLPLPEVFRYFPCFIPGALAYGLMKREMISRVLPFWTNPAVLFATCCIYEVIGPWSQTVGAYPVCAAVGLIIPLAKECIAKRLNSICGAIAKYSYGIYLVHAPILSISYSLPLPTPMKLICFIGGTAVFSVLSFHLIEAPMISLGKRLTRVRAIDQKITATA